MLGDRLPIPILRAVTLFCLCIVLCCRPGRICAQKEGNIWYFGHNAGLDFNNGTPKALTDGQLYTDEGCASISDASGRILFYTDGIKVYNRRHTLMPNGTGLMGNPSSTQSGVIVPVPENLGRYYIFTVDNEGGKNGMRYSVVDLSRDGGNGDIVEKNVLLFTPSTEKITAVKHFNGVDIWVIGHKFNSDSFITYKIDKNGISTETVISRCGIVHGGLSSNAIGYMKASPDASKIALAVNGSNTVEIFDFDPSSGKLANAITMTDTLFYGGPYGIEFSPDASRLYVTTAAGGQKLIQMNVRAASADAMLRSANVIFTGSAVFPQGLQLGPDKKIYCALADDDSMGIINFPDQPGALCQYVNNGIYLQKKTCWLGLPTFIQSYFNPPQIIYNSPCKDQATRFSLSYYSVDAVKWNFGDSSSAALDTSYSFKPSHIYPATGIYKVRCIVKRGNVTDTAVKTISIINAASSGLSGERSICQSKSLVLHATVFRGAYLWNNGSTDSTLLVMNPGAYWVRVTDENGCTNVDTVKVKVDPLPKLRLPADTVVCNLKALIIRPDIPVKGYLRWQDGSHDSIYSASASRKYWLVDSNGCGTASDTMKLDFLRTPHVNLGRDTLLCNGGQYVLMAHYKGCSFTWQNGSSDSFYKAVASGTFWLKASNYCGSSSDTIRLTIQKPPVIHFAKDTIACQLDKVQLDVSTTGGSYLWQDGSTKPSIIIKHPGFFTVRVSNLCGSAEGSINVGFRDCNCYSYIPNAFTPNNDGLNDVFMPSWCIPFAYTMKIYNKWGEQVFTTDDIEKGWDGNFKNDRCPEGVYFYTIYIMNRDNTETYRSGNISLLR